LGPTPIGSVDLTIAHSGLWLEIVLASGVPVEGPTALRARWDAGMLMIALARAAAQGQAPRAPLGMSLSGHGGVFDMTIDQFFHAVHTPGDAIDTIGTQPSPEDIVRHVRGALPAGIHLRSIAFVSQLDLVSPVVVLVVDRRAALANLSRLLAPFEWVPLA